jgi:AcrR family transcriptional regulator
MAEPQPPNRNPDRARRRLMQLPVRHFARQRDRTVSADAIGAPAELNRRVVSHYFGDKHARFEAVSGVG